MIAEVLAMNEINFSGNVIPANWYKHLRYDSGKPNLSAIIILSEIVYWYRPSEVRSEETGELLGYKKKFRADKLQRSHQSFGDQFGLTKKQVRDALTFLEDKGLITKELRIIETQGVTLSNVLFIGIVPAKIKAITLQVTPVTSKSHPPNIEVAPSVPVSQTYTKNTTKNTTNILAKSSKSQNGSFDRADQTDRDNLNTLAEQIATVIQADIDTIGDKAREQLKKLTLALSKKGNIQLKLAAFPKWYATNDWRGKQGQPPTIWTLSDTWGQFEAAKVGPPTNGNGPVLSEAQKARLAELTAENATK